MKCVECKDTGTRKDYILATSCEPCAMCLGGILWSGVSTMLCSATKTDAEAIGFDEGPVFEESYMHLMEADIEIKREILRNDGVAVLEHYGASGTIYKP